MSQYIHKVHYYETDKMGITHHSNYIRFMEEARMSFLTEIGYPMTRFEAEDITSPVVFVNCTYKHSTTYGDEIEIDVKMIEYTGVKLTFEYTMRTKADRRLVAVATSTHCFIDRNGRPIVVKKYFPDFDAILKAMG